MLREPLRGCREAQHEAIGGALPARSSMPRGRRYRDGGGGRPRLGLARIWGGQSSQTGLDQPLGPNAFTKWALGGILWGWYLENLYSLHSIYFV